jgi:uncharacterized membrane protein
MQIRANKSKLIKCFPYNIVIKIFYKQFFINRISYIIFYLLNIEYTGNVNIFSTIAYLDRIRCSIDLFLRIVNYMSITFINANIY